MHRLYVHSEILAVVFVYHYCQLLCPRMTYIYVKHSLKLTAIQAALRKVAEYFNITCTFWAIFKGYVAYVYNNWIKWTKNSD